MRAHNGPAHIAERSTTSGAVDDARVAGPADFRVTTAGVAAASPRIATGMSSKAARSRKAVAETVDANRSTSCHGSPLAGPSINAGTARISSSRARLIATQPSRAGNRRQVPFADVRPRRRQPHCAAREVMMSAIVGISRAGRYGLSASTRPATRRPTGAGGRSGGPSPWPVSHMPPQSIQSRSATPPTPEAWQLRCVARCAATGTRRVPQSHRARGRSRRSGWRRR